MKLRTGDEVWSQGRWYRATQIGEGQVVLTPIGRVERLRRWFGERIQLAGFWSRVWDR